MIIAVNTRVLSGDSAISRLMVDYFEMMAVKYPTQHFIFITEKEHSPKQEKLKNTEWLSLPQQSHNPLFWKLWYNYKLPSALKKHHVDVLVTPDGVCSLRTKIPQCLFVNDLAFLKHPRRYSKKYLQFIKLNTPAFFRKATILLTQSCILKNEITEVYTIPADKISVIGQGVSPEYQPVDWEIREQVKEKYADGREYFLFSGAIHPGSDLLNLLKAFSLFKKRQKSNMLLVIASLDHLQDDTFLESLRLYKYRNDIKLMPGLDKRSMTAITGSAYACINTSSLHSDIAGLLNAVNCGVPVIAGNLKLAAEILGDAVLLVNPGEPESIAEKLMQLYKDENKRTELVKKGRELAANHSLEKTVHTLWQIMHTAIEPA